jgi:hypothetical protein
MDVTAVYIGGSFVTLVNMFITVAGFDYYQKWFFSARPEEKPRRRSRSFYTLHAAGLTTSLLLATVLCATPFFGPFAALPLSQEVRQIHISPLSRLFILYHSGTGFMNVTPSPQKLSSLANRTQTTRPRSLFTRPLCNRNLEVSLPKKSMRTISTSSISLGTNFFNIVL